jgi:hypothetical protein
MTQFPGVTATYDSRTDRYVVAYRNSSWNIAMQTVQAESPHSLGTLRTTGWAAWRTPNIECTDPVYVGGSSNNCVLVWSHNGNFHNLRHAPVSVSVATGQPVEGAHTTTSIKTISTSAVTETRRSDYPFLFAAKQDNTIRTWRRSSTASLASGVTVAPSLATQTYLSPTLSRIDDLSGTPVFHLRYGL